MTQTHIYLERTDRDTAEAAAILVPLAGTMFEITLDYKTLVTLANGRSFTVYESMPEIRESLGDGAADPISPA